MVFKRKTVIRGSFHQGAVEFGPRAGKQCVGNCVAYVCLSIGRAPEALKARDIDEYLNVGCDIYGQVSDFVGQEYLMFSELPSNIKFGRCAYTLDCGRSLFGAILEEGGLFQVLVRAFAEQSAVLLICKGSCIAIKYIGGQYFVFDSHSRDKWGLPCANGSACVIAFVSFSGVVNHCLLLYGKGGNVQYEVVPLAVRKVKVNSGVLEKRVICDLASITVKVRAVRRDIKGDSQSCADGVRENDVAGVEKCRGDVAGFCEGGNGVGANSGSVVIGESLSSVVSVGDSVERGEGLLAESDGSECGRRRSVERMCNVEWLKRQNEERAEARVMFECGELSKVDSAVYVEERAESSRKRQCRRVRDSGKVAEGVVPTVNPSACISGVKRGRSSESDVAKSFDSKVRRRNNDKSASESDVTVSSLGPRVRFKGTSGRLSEGVNRPKVIVETRVGKSGRTLFKCKEVIAKGRKRRSVRRDTCSQLFRDLADKRRALSNARKLNKVFKQRRNLFKEVLSRVVVKNVNSGGGDVGCSGGEVGKTEGLVDGLSCSDLRGDCDSGRGESGGSEGGDEIVSECGDRSEMCSGGGADHVEEPVNFSSVFAEAKRRMNEGPVYVCCVCYIVLFARSVVPVTPGGMYKFTSYLRPDFVGRADLVVCHTCKRKVDKNLVPKCSYKNGMKFPVLPKVLDIHIDEEKLIALRIPFMQLRLLPRGGQVQLYGNVVNVPAAIERGITLLPRYLNEQGTVCVRIKRKLQYKGAYRRFNVEPGRVLAALEYLLENSDIYREANVGVNTDWLAHTIELLAQGQQGVGEVEGDSDVGGEAEVNDGEDLVFFDISDDENDALTDGVSVTSSVAGVDCGDGVEQVLESVVGEDVCSVSVSREGGGGVTDLSDDGDGEGAVRDGIVAGSRECCNSDSRGESDQALCSESVCGVVDTGGCSDDESDRDGFSEVDPSEVTNCLSTLIDEEGCVPFLDVAPGEGNKPLNIVYDEESEEMSFPSVYCGQRIKDIYPEGISFIERCRWELRSDDRRAAKNSELIFFKYKKYQVLFVYRSAMFALRYVKGGSAYTASDVRSETQRLNLSCLDDGYYIYRQLRNSPQYLKEKRQELAGTIRQEGLPTFFVSLSSADSRWPGLIKAIASRLYGRCVTEVEVESMHYLEKCRVLNSDPVTCARFFDNRFKEFLQKVVYHSSKPLGEVVDHFYRIEFQHRGSPHVHMLLFCSDCPKYLPGGDNTQLTAYIDKYISCSLDCSEANKPFVPFQVHRHSKTCRKDEKPVCRFGYPLPPFPKTIILQPNSEKTVEHKQYYERVQSFLDSEENADGLGFNEFLLKVGLSYSDYVLAVRSSLKSDKVMLERKPSECRVNMYMRNLLHVWGANVDCQYCLDAYSVVVYISNYINKQQRGLSLTMSKVIDECKKRGDNIKDTVKAIGNVFLKSSEVSVQEAVYMLLGLPLTYLSRDVVRICTKVAAERAKILLGKSDLEACAEDSEDIFRNDKFDIYSNRPEALRDWCLADYCCRINRVKLPGGGGGEAHRKENRWLCRDNKYYFIERAKRRVLLYFSPKESVDAEEYYRVCFLLFYPWVVEENILQECSNYTELYMSLADDAKEQMMLRRQEYHEQCVEFIVEQSEGQWSEVLAPGCTETDLYDKSLRSVFLSDSCFFKPTKSEDHYTEVVDPGSESINQQSVFNVVDDIWPQGQYLKAVNELNEGQRRAHDYVVTEAVCGHEELRLFITGGAGTGKTKLLSTIYQGLSRFYNLLPYCDPQRKSVLKLAFTGKAAFLIGGETVHSGLQISPRCNYNLYESLSADSMNTLRVKLGSVRVICFDEVSLIGCQFFNFINQRLQDIFGCTSSFGGLHVIAFGDLYQLPPVKDHWIFSDLPRGLASVGTNVWAKEFSMIELTEIMRQRNDMEFANILNRVREGQHSSADVAVLMSRSVSSIPEIKNNCLCLFPTNKEVSKVNSSVFDCSTGEKVTVKSVDKVVGDNSGLDRPALVAKVKMSAGTKTALLEEVQICVGLTYDLVQNVNVEDGLANGCSGIVTYVQYMDGNDTPAIVWLEFQDRTIGAMQRILYKHYFNENIMSDWTPIFAVTSHFCISKGGLTVYRTQFPLKQATAKTVHKSQGSTVDNVVVDLSQGLRVRQLMKHSAYVAMSRVTSMEGLTLVNFDERLIIGDESVNAEMLRLRQNRLLSLSSCGLEPDVPVMYYQNVQHLKPHRECFQRDPRVVESFITFVCECKVLGHEACGDVLKDIFNVYRLDICDDGSYEGAGLMILVRAPSSLTNVLKWRQNMCEVCIGFCSEVYGYVGVFYCNPRAQKQHISDCFRAVRQHVSDGEVVALVGDLNVDANQDVNRHYIQMLCQLLNCYDNVSGSTTRWGTSIDRWFSSQYSSVIKTYLPWSHHYGLQVRDFQVFGT